MMDLFTAADARSEAMARVEVNAEPDWNEFMFDLVERTAPVDPGLARMIRPWLAAAHDVGRAALVRHSDPVPLVVRNVRAESWMGQIKAGNPERAATSTRLIRELEARFGVMPW